METLKIGGGMYGPAFFVEATHKASLPVTDPQERVAWEGTADLYQDGNGQWYLQWHSGNSNHPVQAKKITEEQAKALQKSAEEGSAEELREFVFFLTTS